MVLAAPPVTVVFLLTAACLLNLASRLATAQSLPPSGVAGGDLPPAGGYYAPIRDGSFGSALKPASFNATTDAYIRVGKGRETQISFRKLFPSLGRGMVVSIDNVDDTSGFPKLGHLYAQVASNGTGSAAPATSNAPAPPWSRTSSYKSMTYIDLRSSSAKNERMTNEFRYRSTSRPKPATGSDGDASSAVLNTNTKEFPTGLEVFVFHIDEPDHFLTVRGTLYVEVYNSAPAIRDRVYRMPPTANVDVKRTFTMQVIDDDARWVDPDVREIEQVTVISAPGPDTCTITRQLANSTTTIMLQNGTQLLARPIGATRRQSRVAIEGFSVTFPDIISGSPCSLTVQARDASGNISNVAALSFTPIKEEPPYVVNTTAKWRLGIDKVVFLELVGYSANSVGGTNNPVTFQVLSLPILGRVLKVNDTELFKPNESNVVVVGSEVYSGRKTRVVLVLDVSDIDPATVNMSSSPLQLVFKVTGKTSGLWSVGKVSVNLVVPQSPICGTTEYYPVFWDQPVRNIIPDYDENGGVVDRVVLAKLPDDALGDLYVVSSPRANKLSRFDLSNSPATQSNLIRDTLLSVTDRIDEAKELASAQKLKLGDVIQSSMRKLRYSVRPEKRTRHGTDTFVFRAVAQSQLSCHGNITFHVLPHDQAATTATGELRYDLAPAGALTVLPLWGLANRSLRPDLPGTVKVVVDNVDGKFGANWFVLDTFRAPYDGGFMYRSDVRAQPYCERFNCSAFIDASLPIVPGSTVVPSTVWAREGVEESDPRPWVVISLPPSEAVTTMSTEYTSIAFHYEQRVNESYVIKTRQQTLGVFQRPGKKRVVYCDYQPLAQRNQDLGAQRELEIPCRISEIASPSLRAYVFPFDTKRRHGRAASFRIFNALLDGNRVKRTARLAPQSLFNLPEQMWVLNEKTWVVVVPSVRAVGQQFQFRARIYPDSDSEGWITRYEDVRVIVRRLTEPPQWTPFSGSDGERDAPENPTSMIVPGNETTRRFQLRVTSKTDDIITFRVLVSPKYGYLLTDVFSLGLSQTQRVGTGSRVRPPPGTSERQSVMFTYVPQRVSFLQYPLNDTIVVVAEDGSGLSSAPRQIVFQVAVSAEFLASVKDLQHGAPPSPVLAIALVGVVIVGTVVVTIGLIRRRGRERYLFLPKVTGGGATSAVPDTEMN